MSRKSKHIFEFNEYIKDNNDYYQILLEEYSNQSKHKSFKEFILHKANRAKDVSKNVIKAFKEEGSETSDMLSTFNRYLRDKLNLNN